MPFDYVTPQERYVTLPELRRHAVLRVYSVHLIVRDLFLLDLESVLQQVTYPPRAASSRGAFVHGNAGVTPNLLRQGRSRQQQK